MTEQVSEPLEAAEPALDPRRIRTFVGLILGRLGPRAFGAVAGIFLALLVAEHTRSLVAVTFALTAHRIVTWLAFPLAGRLSDRSDTTLGRRVPFMVLGLLVGGICTALLVEASSYWQLVGLVMIARLAFVMYTVPAAAVTPEAFGNSRWLRAGVAVMLGGLVVGMAIRVTALATWDQSDPSTWAPAYYLSAGFIVFAALAIVALVREAPMTKQVARRRPAGDLLATARSVLDQPHARPLLAGVLLAIASGGAFDRAYPIYAERVLGAGGDALAAGGIATAILSCMAFPISWVIAHRVSRRNTALWAGITGAAGALAHLWITEFWQSVVIGVVSQIFLVSAVLALAPLYLRILPRDGGLGERIGTIISPILVAGMIASFGTGALYDYGVQNYRVIWIPTAIFGLAGGIVIWAGLLKSDEGAARAHPGRMFKTLKRLLWGRRNERQLFRGELAEHEVDGAALLEAVADELNPYMQRD